MNHIVKMLGFFTYTLTFFIPKMLNAETSTTFSCDKGKYLEIKEEIKDGVTIYSPNGCTGCNSGYYCAGIENVTCKAGQATDPDVCTSDVGQTKCPSGHICPTPELDTPGDTCPAGTFCPEGSAKTTPCPENHYCPESGQAEATDQCPDSFTSSPGSSGLTDCKKYFEPGEYYIYDETKGGTSGTCPLGSYREGGQSINPTQNLFCQVCDAGKTTSAAKSTSRTDCKDCTNENNKISEFETPTWSKDAPTIVSYLCMVKSCSNGYRKQQNPGQDPSCEICPEGQWVENTPEYGNGTQCKPTPTGMTSVSGETGLELVLCSGGTYNDGKQNGCVPIAAGYYSNCQGAYTEFGTPTDTTTTSKCQSGIINAGFYANGGASDPAPSGKAYCNNKDCGKISAGYWSAGGAKTATPTSSSSDCISGKCGYIEAGYYGNAGATTSKGDGQIAAGYYSVRGGTSRTGSCAEGGNQCGYIAGGYYGNAGATSSTGDGKIAAGYYSAGGAIKSNPTNSSDCNGQACGPIAAGYYGNAGATTSNGKGKIAAGYYSAGGATTDKPTGKADCNNGDCGYIAGGYYSAGGAKTRTGDGKIAAGYYSEGGGTTSGCASTDINCSKACLTDFECDSCALGTNNQFPNSAAGSTKNGCYVNLPSGYYTYKDSKDNWYTGICPQGTYSNTTQDTITYFGDQKTCSVCPTGKTTSGLGHISETACSVVCTTDNNVASWVQGEVCKVDKCKAGNYKNQNTCTTCPNGKYIDYDNAATQCNDATPGYQIKDNTSQELCPGGTYNPGGDGNDKCKTLPAGYYSAGGAKKSNPTKSSDCVGGNCGLIDAGYYGNAGATSSAGAGQITAGYYSAGGAIKSNPTSNNDCISEDCGLIDAGYYGNAGATSSTGHGEIAAGYYSAGGAIKSNPTKSSDCVGGNCGLVLSGFYSAGGAKKSNPTSNNDCISQKCGYIDGGYWGENGATSSTGFGKIAAGYYSVRGGTSVTGSCAEGGNQCGIIAAGYYGNAGAKTSNGNGTVNAGYYSAGGAKTATPTGSGDCISGDCGPIAAGYYGNAGAKTSNGHGEIAAGYWSAGGAKTDKPTNPTNDCPATKQCGYIAGGYYSEGGATTSTPNSEDCVGGKCGLVSASYYSEGGGTSATPQGTDNGCVNGTNTQTKKQFQCGPANNTCFAEAGSTQACPLQCISGTTPYEKGCAYDISTINFVDIDKESFKLPFTSEQPFTTSSFIRYMYTPPASNNTQ